MIRRSRKSIMLVLALITVVSLIVSACSKGSGSDSGSTASPSTSPSAAPVESKEPTPSESVKPELPPVKLSWYFAASEQDGDKEVFAAANKIIQEKINATVDFYPLGFGDYKQKMSLKMSANEEFDLMWTAHNFLFLDGVTKGGFAPLNALIDEYMPLTKAAIPEKIWRGPTVKGEIYAVPNYQVSFSQPALIFNKALVDKYNLKDQLFAVKKMSDLTPIFQVIKDNEPNIVPSSVTPTNWYKWDVLDKSQYLDSVGPVKVLVDTSYNVLDPTESVEINKKALESFDLSKEWRNKGFYHPDAGIAKDFNAEKAAGKFFVLEDVFKPGVESDMKARYGYDVYAIPMGQAIISTNSINGTLTAISRTSKNPERAAMLLELVNNDKELYNLLVFGIEGKHYKKTGPDSVEPIAGSGYAGLAWMMGTQFLAYKLPGQSDDVWEVTKQLNESANPSTLMGFTIDTEPLKTLAANLSSAGDGYSTPDGNSISAWGLAKDAEAIMKEQQKKALDAGLLEYIDLIQQQIDAWRASQ